MRQSCLMITNQLCESRYLPLLCRHVNCHVRIKYSNWKRKVLSFMANPPCPLLLTKHPDHRRRHAHTSNQLVEEKAKIASCIFFFQGWKHQSEFSYLPRLTLSNDHTAFSQKKRENYFHGKEEVCLVWLELDLCCAIKCSSSSSFCPFWRMTTLL